MYLTDIVFSLVSIFCYPVVIEDKCYKRQECEAADLRNAVE